MGQGMIFILARQRFLLACCASVFLIAPSIGQESVPQKQEAAVTIPMSVEYHPGKKLCELKNKDINESSGLAVSRHNPRLLWTHNDSGDKAKLYCIDLDGRDMGTCKLKNIKAIDWEDLCSYTIDGKRKLLIADVGDNGRRRKDVMLHIIDEPKNPKKDAKEVRTLRLTFDSGPIDCEAVGVDTVSRQILLVEKKKLGLTARIYMTPLPKDDDDETTIQARKIATLKLPIVTAMDISPDGHRAVVMTIGQAFEYLKKKGETWQDAFRRERKVIDLPPRRQGEAICYGANGRDLYLTSELRPTPLFFVEAKR